MRRYRALFSHGMLELHAGECLSYVLAAVGAAFATAAYRNGLAWNMPYAGRQACVPVSISRG